MSSSLALKSRTDLGLQILHDSPQAKVDIVFIHGLYGHMLMTWTDPKTSGCWPRDFLPGIIPDARILTYGYEYIPPRFYAVNTNYLFKLDDLAWNLLCDLEAVRSVVEHRPLIFVAHSLGGLLCKKAVILAGIRPETTSRKLSQSIFGVVFMGTPQQESSATNFGLLGGIVAFTQTLAVRAQNWTNRDTESLTSLNHEFLAYIRRQEGGRAIKTLSCFEENETKYVGSVVPEAIATIPGGSKMSLPGDHSRMVKFGSKEDLGFQKISSFLKMWTDELQVGESSAAKRIESNSSYSVEFADRSRCLNSLAVYSQGQRESQIKYATAGTCEWILRNSAYRKWMDFDDNSAENGHLWIEGIAGSGKSTLLQFLVRHFEAHAVPDILSLAFFFNSRGHRIERSAIGLYGCLLYQLLQIIPDAWVDFFPRLLEREGNRGIHADWNREELSQAFEMVLNSCPPKYSRLVIFIDGLDECDSLEEGRRVVEHFIRVRDRFEYSGMILKICWSTRPIFSYAGFDAVLRIRLEHENYADIERFINQKLEGRGLSIASRQELVEKSQGMFQWADLAIRQILEEKDGSPRATDLPTTVINPPAGLTNLYESFWFALDFSSRRRVLEIVQWVTFAFQPLTIEELGLGLSFGAELPPDSLKDAITADKFAANRPQQLRNFVRDTLGGFIHIIERDGNRLAVLQFSDSTVQEFLWKQSSLHLFGIEAHEDAIAKTHLKLARACCNYVRVKEITQNAPAFSLDAATWIKRLVDAYSQDQKLPASFQGTSFTAYVVRYLFEHAKRSLIPFGGREGILRSEKAGSETTSFIGGLTMLYCTVLKNSETIDNHEKDRQHVQAMVENIVSAILDLRGPVSRDLHDPPPPYDEDPRHDHVGIPSFSLLTVHDAVLTELANHSFDFAILDVKIECEIANFMHANFERTQPLGPVLVLIGISDVTQAATCAEYMTSRWGDFGLAILDFVDSMLREKRQHTVAESTNFHMSRTTIEDLNIVAGWQNSDGLGPKENISIRADGPPKMLAALTEIFSWLTAALRHASIDGVACSDVSVAIWTHKSLRALQCSIQLRDLESLSRERPGSCWYAMYKNTIVVDSLKSARSDPGAGLDIGIQRLANLTGATTPIEYEGGVLLLGRSCILIPVEGLPNGGLLWHLLYSPGKEQIELSEVDSQLSQRLLVKDVSELLRMSHHRVGLWSTSKIILGTREACYDNIEWTTKPEKKSKWQYQGFSLPFTIAIPHGPGFGIVNNFAVAKQQLNSSSGEVDYVALILNYSKRPLLVYDPHPAERQAWLVPTLSFVLHLVHLYVRYHNLEVDLPYAKAISDGGAAALEAIKGRAESTILALGDEESNILTLGKLLRIICLNILRMAPKKSRLPFGTGTQVMGYEFGDIATVDPTITLRKSEYAFNATHEGWSTYFSPRVTFILCKGLGKAIVPDEWETSSVTEENMLIAPLRCLEPLVQKSSGDIKKGVLGDGYFLHSLHSPFGPCDHCWTSLARNQAVADYCSRIQWIEKKRWVSGHQSDSGIGATRYGYSDGAIVIGRSVNDKNEVVVR